MSEKMHMWRHIISKGKKPIFGISNTLISMFLLFFSFIFVMAHFSDAKSTSGFFLSVRFFVDALSVIFLIVMLLHTSKLSVFNSNIFFIRTGFVLWITGQALDLADELSWQPHWVAFWGEDLIACAGMVIVCIFSLRLINDISQDYFSAQMDALTDELTQLPNRRFFFEKLSKLERESFSLLLIDIDDFKSINDRHGHDTGDAVLRRYGELMIAFADREGYPARIGGDEFCLLVGTTGEDALNIARQLISISNTVTVAEGNMMSVTIGVGSKREGETCAELMKRVDSALLSAKRSGRGRAGWAV